MEDEARTVKVFAARPGDVINLPGFGEMVNDPGAPADEERGIPERPPRHVHVMVTEKVARELEEAMKDQPATKGDPKKGIAAKPARPGIGPKFRIEREAEAPKAKPASKEKE